jgi:hypothetical protein
MASEISPIGPSTTQSAPLRLGELCARETLRAGIGPCLGQFRRWRAYYLKKKDDRNW